MSDSKRDPQSFVLDSTDIEALRWAVRFTSQDETRPILGAIYFDLGGKIVSCNGSRMLVWQSAALKSVPSPTAVGPVRGIDIPGGSSATLEIHYEETRLSVEDKYTILLPIMPKSYVKYEQVLPSTWDFRVMLQAGAMVTTLPTGQAQ